ncbi:MAG: YfhO family protein [Anaerolineaceae bacterium]|nr:YfhO family protein [Anaerolineaceae bacterium]
MIKKRLIVAFQFPYLPLWFAPLGLIAPVLFTGKAVYWGTPYLQFVPWRTLAVQILQSRQFPLWNPLNGMGTPLLANYQSGLLYPPNWFLLGLQAIGGTAMQAWGQGILILFHWVLASIGMAMLVRRIGVNPLGQAVSGLAFGLSAYLVTRSGFLSMNATLAWLPLVMLFACRIACPIPAKKPVKPYRLFDRVVPLGIVIGLMLLAGHAQIAWYTLLLAAVWVGIWSQHNTGWHGMVHGLVDFAFAGVLGAGLAAAQLIPTTEFLLQSQRASAVDYGLALNYSFWPWRLLTLIAPVMFGSPVSGDYWYAAYYWEDAIYIGLLPLLLAILGAMKIFRMRRDGEFRLLSKQYLPLVGFLLMLLPITLMLALGGNTPVFPALYQYIPTFNMFQAPTRWMIWFVFILALLAGIGVQVWKRPEGRGLYWARLATAGAAAVLIGSGVAWVYMGGVTPTFVRALALAGLYGVGAGLLNLYKPVQSSPPWLTTGWGWGVIVLVAVDLVTTIWGMNPGINLAFYREPATNQAEVSRLLNGKRLYISRSDENILKYERFFQVKTLNPPRPWDELKGYFLANANIFAGIASVNNYDPLVPGRYARWMDYLDQASPDLKQVMLRLMAVSVVEKPDENLEAGVRFEPLQAAAKLSWAACAQFAINEEDAWRIFSQLNTSSTRAVPSDKTIVVEGSFAAHPVSCHTAGIAKIDIIDENTQQLKLKITTDDGGWLVQADTWYPGWRAVLDGKQVPIRVANTLFRAIEIPQGIHELAIEYRPGSFRTGVGISILAGFGLVVWFVVRKRTGRNRPSKIIEDEHE